MFLSWWAVAAGLDRLFHERKTINRTLAGLVDARARAVMHDETLPPSPTLTAAPRLSGALAAITAAVVGVIAHLSLWFALHVLFAVTWRVELGPVSLLLPEIGTLRPLTVAIALGAGWLLLARHWPLPAVLALAALASAAASLF